MLVRITKREDGRHRLTVVRDDGSVSQGKVVPGLGPDAIPHDLLHAIVEKTLGFQRGVFGMIGTGLDIAELLHPARKEANKSEPELMLSEVITTSLQSEAAHLGVDKETFSERIRAQSAQQGLAVPTISDDVLDHLRALRDQYQRRWAELATGETIEVELPGRARSTALAIATRGTATAVAAFVTPVNVSDRKHALSLAPHPPGAGGAQA